MLSRRALSFAVIAGIAVEACGAPVAPPPAPRPIALSPAPALAASVTSPALPTELAVAPLPASALPPPVPAAPPPAPAAPRLTSLASTSWIYGRPKVDGRYLGYVRLGSSIALRTATKVAGEGCSGGFFAVEPRGFVCDDHTVTLTPPPRFAAVAAVTAASPGPLPYGYAFSDGAPMYTRLPSLDEQRRAERKLGPADSRIHPHNAFSTYEDLASNDAPEHATPAPAFLETGEERLVRDDIPRGSMLSFTRVYEAAGRTFLLSADHTLVPADRVRLFHRSSFHGVHLGSDLQLPLAWLRRVDHPQYRRFPSGALEATGAAWAARTYVRVTGVVVEHERHRYLETRDRDAAGAPLYLALTDASVVEAAPKLPIGVKPGQKWIVVHLGDGTLVAYEGLSPVFTTLMSPGRGGIPVVGRDPVEASTTPLGVFYVTFKDRAAVMTHDKPGEPRTHWIADVPFTQYFDPPFALHAAYWHDRFGEETSAGCVNVSPADAETLFQWSDPPVPPDWQGASGAGAPENGPTTAVVVRR